MKRHLDTGAWTARKRVLRDNAALRTVVTQLAGRESDELICALLDLMVEQGGTDKSSDPMSRAAGNGQTGVIRVLHQLGMSVDRGEESIPLFHAVVFGQSESLRTLHALGANLVFVVSEEDMQKFVDPEGGNLEMISEIDRMNSVVPCTPYYAWGDNLMTLAARCGQTEIVRVLHELGVSVDTLNSEEEQTPLSFAAANGHFETAKALCELGAKLNCGDQSPLMNAAAEGHYEIVRYLHEMGADLDRVCVNGSSALIMAIEGGHTRMACLLLDLGASFRAVNVWRQSAAQVACWKGDFEVVNRLSELGADFFSEDNHFGKTTIQYAIQHSGMVRLIVDRTVENATHPSQIARRVVEKISKKVLPRVLAQMCADYLAIV